MCWLVGKHASVKTMEYGLEVLPFADALDAIPSQIFLTVKLLSVLILSLLDPLPHTPVLLDTLWSVMPQENAKKVDSGPAKLLSVAVSV